MMSYTLREINRDNFLSCDKAIDDIAKITYSFGEAYPEIKTWFHNKVIPGLHSGERIMLYVPSDKGIVALAILKDSPLEKKICTFYVSPEVRGKGLADILFIGSFEKLKTVKPLISVPENTLNRFKKYFAQYKFHQTSSRFLTSKNMREFVYNG
ncbi:MAG TPA: hypothetical protein VIT44_02680 [Cyclobacteriaceae bacterium]